MTYHHKDLEELVSLNHLVALDICPSRPPAMFIFVLVARRGTPWGGGGEARAEEERHGRGHG